MSWGNMDSVGGEIFVVTYSKLQEYFNDFYRLLAGEWETPARIVMTLYIVIIGYRLVMGKYGESSKQMLSIILFAPIIFVLVFDTALFADWIVNPILETMLGLMSLFIDKNGSHMSTMFTHLDDVFGKIFISIDVASDKVSSWDIIDQAKLLIVQLLLGLTYGILYVIFFVLLILGIFALHVFFVIGSIPLFLAIFPDTRHIFFAWLKSILNYALIPIFTAIVMSITLYFLDNALVSIQALDVNKDGVFNQSIGHALFVGIMSIYFHMKAPEFAAAITGGQASGAGGFFGTVGGIGAMAALVSNKTGLTGAASGAASWGKGAAGSGLDRMTGGNASKAFSKLKGVGN